ncbi:MAG: hypothetical protein JWP65_1909 [Ramlibacter sp.]|uniref:hypothetical protein n=1 Tax=Ramlibacter sp. TaxID=1917967 RepID=UPI00262DD0CC|nr:hypothetical protein [Ramlibacter sp.]MDB5751488.1 hypothetical protein [Ramlibacter sp.]
MGRTQQARDHDDAAAPGPGQQGPPPFWEWMVAGLGLLLVLACLGYLVVQALAGPPTPPDPKIDVVAVHAQGGRFLVELRVTNSGRATAEALKIGGDLKQGDTVLEHSETEFQFLPGESSRQAGLFFVRDPRRFTLELQAVSYQAP